MYDASFSDGQGNSVNATLVAVGVTIDPTTSYVYDYDQQWYITINSGTGDLAQYAGLTLNDTYFRRARNASYLYFDDGQLADGHLFYFQSDDGTVLYYSDFDPGYYYSVIEVYTGTNTVYTGSATFDPVVADVPEPTSFGLTVAGLLGLGAIRRKSKRSLSA